MGFIDFFNDKGQVKEASRMDAKKTSHLEEKDSRQAVKEENVQENEQQTESVKSAETDVEGKTETVSEKSCSQDQIGLDVVLAQLKALNLKVDQLSHSNNESAKLEEKEEIIKLQHNQLLKYQDDLLWRSHKDSILEMIGIADNIRMIIDKQSEDKNQLTQEELYAELVDDVKGLLSWVESVLANSGVKAFKDVLENPLSLNPKRQKIVDVESAQDPSLVGSYKSAQPGYEWSIPYLVIKSDVQLQKIIDDNKVPQKLGFVIRPEEVIKMK